MEAVVSNMIENKPVVDIVKLAECLVTFAENSIHGEVLDTCNEMISVLEEVREQAVKNIRLAREANNCLDSIEDYK